MEDEERWSLPTAARGLDFMIYLHSSLLFLLTRRECLGVRVCLIIWIFRGNKINKNALIFQAPGPKQINIHYFLQLLHPFPLTLFQRPDCANICQGILLGLNRKRNSFRSPFCWPAKRFSCCCLPIIWKINEYIYLEHLCFVLHYN